MTLSTQYLRKNSVFDFPRIINQVFDTWPAVSERELAREFIPAVDVGENETHYFVAVDLPGVKKEDVKVEVKDNVLKIFGERRFEKTEKEKNRIQFFERQYGAFERRFELPQGSKPDDIEARFEDGVLELTVPKAEPNKPKLIEIKSGK